MRAILILLFTFAFNFQSFNQELRVLKPKIGEEKIFLAKDQKDWERAWQLKYADDRFELEYDTLSPRDKELFNALEDFSGPSSGIFENWNSVAYPDSIIASSEIKPSKSINYFAKNVNDANLLTAWVPSNEKSSISEKISFYFKAFAPRVHTIIVFNGYLKNIDLWKQNSRVKQFRMSVNEKPYAILDLEDTTAPQSFKFEPLQSKTKDKPLIITLEILEIYKGDKWNDTVITEINFDGMDVF